MKYNWFLLQNEPTSCQLPVNKLRIVRQQFASLSTSNCGYQANKFESCKPTSLRVASP